MTIAERFADAFNRRDVEGLLACFSDDATYADLLLGQAAGPVSPPLANVNATELDELRELMDIWQPFL